jgi:phosphodiesterase/alkaline phosphatase D-like protein
MPAPLRRRSFIQATGASLGAMSLRGFALDKPAAAHFTHGIASGDPLADRVILWTRVLPGSSGTAAVPCTWQMATDDTFETIVASGEGDCPRRARLHRQRRRCGPRAGHTHTAIDSWPMA